VCRTAPSAIKKLQPVNTAAQREEHDYRLFLITAYDVVILTSICIVQCVFNVLLSGTLLIFFHLY